MHDACSSDTPQQKREKPHLYKGQAGKAVHTFSEGQQAWANSLRGGDARRRRRRMPRSAGVDIDNLVFANLYEVRIVLRRCQACICMNELGTLKCFFS